MYFSGIPPIIYCVVVIQCFDNCIIQPLSVLFCMHNFRTRKIKILYIRKETCTVFKFRRFEFQCHNWFDSLGLTVWQDLPWFRLLPFCVYGSKRRLISLRGWQRGPRGKWLKFWELWIVKSVVNTLLHTPHLMPTWSTMMPLMTGLEKAPKANEAESNPETTPYVSKLSAKPWRMASFRDVTTAVTLMIPMPIPAKTRLINKRL